MQKEKKFWQVFDFNEKEKEGKLGGEEGCLLTIFGEEALDLSSSDERES